MNENPPWKRLIVFDGPAEALGSKTDAILSRLGYRLVLPETFEGLRSADASLAPDLLLIDERRMEDGVTARTDPGTREVPIVLLTGKAGAVDAHSRIVGAVKRPAGLHDLYRLLQQVFEDTPRSTPRIATQLHVRCNQGERAWDGRVLSLSENGCLMRSSEEVSLGQRIQVEFSLPSSGALRLEAEAAYQLLPDTGFVFSAVMPAHRKHLEAFVTQAILAD